MEARRFVQMISGVISLVAGASLIYYANQQRWRSRYILIAPIFCFIHIFIYYLAVFLFSGGPNLDFIWWGFNMEFNAWSAGVTLHTVITITFLSYVIIRLCRPPKIT